nr:l10-interacting myb domain-containing protein [Quercus suber]
MSKGKEKVSSNKQFKWLPPMHEMMLRILAQEAVKGNNPSSTFKAGSFALVAKEITTQIGVECHPSYVDNRMRTLRTMWSTIEKLRKKNGFGWDDNLKMITCDAKTYQEEVMAHRKHVEYLNKKIEMYDELVIVVGKDIATGGFYKSYMDIENEPDNGDSAEFVVDNVEEALKEINWGSVDYTALYNEVMAMMTDGYSEDMLTTAFDHLCENENAARGFLAKNARLRKLWLDGFLFTQL